MKIILVHGAGLGNGYKKIQQIKKEFTGEVKEFRGKDIEYRDLEMEVMGGRGLFSDKKLIILENLEKNFDLKKINEFADVTLVLFFTKNLTANNAYLKLARELKFDIYFFAETDEVSVFPFLDMLAEKKIGALSEFEKLYAKYGGQYILTMIFYQLRKFILTPKKLPDFVLKKINRQKQYFTNQRVKELYKYVLETDYKIKNGLIDEKLGITLVCQKFLVS